MELNGYSAEISSGTNLEIIIETTTWRSAIEELRDFKNSWEEKKQQWHKSLWRTGKWEYAGLF